MSIPTQPHGARTEKRTNTGIETPTEAKARTKTGTETRTEMLDPSARELIGCVLLGTLMGFALIKGEIVSWFRIQEMFRFHALHMYLIMGSAIVVAMAGLKLLERSRRRALNGQPIGFPPKDLGGGYRYWIGGTIFGVGWGITGACPGPLFALLASGVPALLVVIAGAMAGTWLYGWLRPHLPH